MNERRYVFEFKPWKVELTVNVNVKTDTAQVKRITAELDESTDKLEAAVAANQPKP